MANQMNRDAHHAYETKIMMSKPITDLARLIGRKWFLPLEKLAERSGVSVWAILKILNGEKVAETIADKLRHFLENYKGEYAE